MTDTEDAAKQRLDAENARQKRIDDVLDGLSSRINDLTSDIGIMKKNDETHRSNISTELLKWEGKLSSAVAARAAIQEHRGEDTVAGLVDDLMSLFEI